MFPNPAFATGPKILPRSNKKKKNNILIRFLTENQINEAVKMDFFFFFVDIFKAATSATRR
jgi:hypothetical protein